MYSRSAGETNTSATCCKGHSKKGTQGESVFTGEHEDLKPGATDHHRRLPRCYERETQAENREVAMSTAIMWLSNVPSSGSKSSEVDNQGGEPPQ